MAYDRKVYVCYFLIFVTTSCPHLAGAGKKDDFNREFEDILRYEEEITKRSPQNGRHKEESPNYAKDAPISSVMFERKLENVDITTNRFDHVDLNPSQTSRDGPISNVLFPESDGHIEDSSLTVFDKRRHFEVSDMTARDKDFDEPDFAERRQSESLAQKLRNLKIIGSKPVNQKRNRDDSNLETSVNKDHTNIPLRRRDFASDLRALRKDAETAQSNATNAFSNKRDSPEALKPVGRRPNNALRELASKKQQDSRANKNIQNDHDGYMTNLEETATANKGQFINYNNGQFEQPKITYTDKIRQLSRKLNDPFYAKNLNSLGVAPAGEVSGVSCDFEKPCAWRWNTSTDGNGFEVMSPVDVLNQNSSKSFMLRGPDTDADFNENGHFLYLAVGPTTEVMTIASPEYNGIMEKCRVEVWLHQHNMQNASFKVVTEPVDYTPPWVLSEIQGNDYERWTKHSFSVGRVQRNFQIVLEVVPGALGVTRSGHIAMDNLKMAGCFAEMATVDQCSARQLKCLANKVPACINSSRVCDILEDCDQGEDERQDCDKMPFGARCSFEEGWCGWSNTRPPREGLLKWQRHSGPTPTPNTGPETDHTCQGRAVPPPPTNQATVSNSTLVIGCIGRYLYVNMNGTGGHKDGPGFAANANLDSVIFNPPPKVHGDQNSKYYNSCMIRFYYHQYGKNSGSIALLLIELKDKENSTELIWRSSKNQGIDWIRAVVILPNVTTRYYLQLEARRGMRVYSDVAVDDFSMSPECFGINIPSKVLGDYNYWDPVHSGANAKPHKDFENKTYYELNTCGSTGRFGPSQEQCDAAYKNTSVGVRVMSAELYKGVQAWTVPTEGFYTVIVHGAGGGLGSGGMGSSRGASARALLDLHKGQVLYMLIGQQGMSACIKTLSVLTESNCKHLNNSTASSSDGFGDTGAPYYHSKTHEIKNTVIQDGGGGGGGGTFLFVVDKQRSAFPLVVGGGGGGLGAGRASSGGSQHGRGAPPLQKRPHTGHMYGPPTSTPGAGGGWSAGTGLVTAGHEEVRGDAASAGGAGGRACSGDGGPGAGGFGGGGGGCARGGAGGGWAGGDTSQNMTNGEGGYSFIDHSWAAAGFIEINPGAHSGSGQVIIIPAIEGCGCDYRCIALDEYRSKTQCICPQGWIATGRNQTTCELLVDWGVTHLHMVIIFGVVSLLLIIALTGIFIMLYNRYQVRKQAALRHKALLEQDLRLSRLRSTADDSALTSFNPNYGCDAVLAGGVDVRQLPQVARDSLRLVKALGQGAFGEVYQGLYRHRDGDAIEMPVAVKTLPEMSTGQSETDFLMEAAIMAKFNHPNIVHLIGVCFDRHPRFIVLELLAGGDLKNFLRENRPKPERSSSLGMKDLVLCALDVAKGCRYMETKRFIHRDIAARNCLLTSKGPGRVVKIADFGMARDIYRSDYYRKGGKAMLPIKWMPPEAFLDGIFTSKTDVWSFGVLLWEVFSLGIMPYTGCANREVMQMVTGGGRLDIPHGCPMEIYRMMCDCWNPSPQDRPTFSQLFERLTHCTQDPELMIAPLPCFNRPESIGRETDGQGQTLQQPGGMLRTSDYLVPLLPVRPADFHQAHGSTDPTLQLPNNGEVAASTAANGLSSSQANDTSNVGSPLTNHKAAFKQLYPPEYGNIALASRINSSCESNGYHNGNEAKSQNDNNSKMNNANHSLKLSGDANYSVKYQSVDGNYSAKINDNSYATKFQNDSYAKNNQNDAAYVTKNIDSGYGSKSSDSTVSSMGSKLENLMGHTSKFQPSKSTDRLLASMEAAAGSQDDDDLNDAETRGEEWETSFTEPPTKMPAVGKTASCNTDTLNPGPAVEKLISIDTPQQTPTSLQPPDTSLSKNNYQNRTANHIPPKQDTVTPNLPKVQNTETRNSSPPYKKMVLPMANANYAKHRPLCLDAAQLEQNLNALKKNSGSVNLNNMNILPPYVNVLTPNKLSKKSESRKIQIDPKKAIIHDLASPPGAEANKDEVDNVKETAPEPRLKTSSSSHSLINGPLTDLPYADSDNVSSSSSSAGANVISKMAPGSKQNNYTEVTIKEEGKKIARKQNSTGGFLNNDSEISC